LKPELWGSPLVQEKYQEEKAYDKGHPYRSTTTIIIIIMIIIIIRRVTRTLEKKNSCGVMMAIPVGESTLRRSVCQVGV
jgi:hypothetical protein